MEPRPVYWHIDTHPQMGEDEFTFCPLCGSHLSEGVIDHKTRLFCPACSYIHFRNPAPTVSLLIAEGDRILLGKRTANPGPDRWATPSGYMEFDEDFVACAVREAREETGLEVEIVSILDVTDSFFPPSQHFLNVYLLASVIGGELHSGDDIGELAWFPLCGPLPEMAFQEDTDLIARYTQAMKTAATEKKNIK